jgi:hypothetical protein
VVEDFEGRMQQMREAVAKAAPTCLEPCIITSSRALRGKKRGIEDMQRAVLEAALEQDKLI